MKHHLMFNSIIATNIQMALKTTDARAKHTFVRINVK